MKKRMIRTAACLLAAVLFTQGAYAAPNVSAECAILIDGDTGTVLYEKNACQRALIASTTKIMTAIVVLEHCDLKRQVCVPKEAVGIEGSSMYLKENEQLTVEELLYGMMLHSGNDAAIALALVCSGSVEEFVALMNLKAQQLSLHHTHFENPNGLDGKQHYSTASDLARMTQYALQNQAFRRIVSTKKITLGNRCLTNHNKLLWSAEGVIGVKTGYTRAAGRILVSAAERKGRTLIAVTINDGNDWEDHKALYDEGFERYHPRCLIEKGSVVGSVSVMGGGHQMLLAGQKVELEAADSEQPEIHILYPKFSFSPGIIGTKAGYAGVWLGQRRLATIPLLWGEVEENHEGTNTENTVHAWSSLPSGR